MVNEDISVSSEHCRSRAEEGGFVVHDRKSTNGTLRSYFPQSCH